MDLRLPFSGCEQGARPREYGRPTSRPPDRRTGRVFVHENDALASGKRPALEGARVRVEAERAGQRHELARGVAGPGGGFGFPTPSDAASEDVFVTVEADGFNPRHVRLGGTSLVLDLARALHDG